MNMHTEFITRMTYEDAFKRIASTDTINKLKRLSKDNNMSLSAYLKYTINELYDLKYNSRIGGQNAN